MLLEAYFDESQRDVGILSVAGFAFAPPQAKKFAKDWTALFPKGCHMKELSQRRGRFSGISQAESSKLLIQAIKLINARVSFGVCASVDIEEMQRVMPSWIRGLEHPYPILCHMAMTNLGLLIEEHGGGYSVDYVFESGHAKEKAAESWMSYAPRAPELSRSYFYRSHRFAANSSEPALQAADILAWEWAKYMDETVSKRLAGLEHRRIRRSLSALFMGGQLGSSDIRIHKYKVAHVTGPSLADFAAKLTDLGIQQIQESSAATGKPTR